MQAFDHVHTKCATPSTEVVRPAAQLWRSARRQWLRAGRMPTLPLCGPEGAGMLAQDSVEARYGADECSPVIERNPWLPASWILPLSAGPRA